MNDKKMTRQFEFFGPHGPAVLILALPAVIYGLVLSCNQESCIQIFPRLVLPAFKFPGVIFSFNACYVLIAWMLTVVLLHVCLPGKRLEGVLLPNNKRLKYKLNSGAIFIVIYVSLLYFGFVDGRLNLGWAYDNFVPLITASILFSFTLSIFLYIYSFRRGALLSVHGNTGYPIYDFWMGRELNPRLGSLDLKEFCEIYPGLIGWAVLNLSFACRQRAALGYVTNSMWMVNIFQLYYVADAVFNEPSILTTMDITTEGFGFMLAFGDLTWVPFTYTTAARFLVDYPQDLPLYAVGLILLVKLLGYVIFRGANCQKDTFRRNPEDPSVRHLKTLPTARGTKLIISGWWGMSRHINYLGDWLMGVAWCLPTGAPGLKAVVPFFYCIYFACLLIHRENRDSETCRQKYGKDWEKYCKLVRYKIVPYVY